MAMKNFAFKVLNTDNFARTGLIETHRGKINTPAFMPVGTQATVKACTIDDIKKTGSEIILSGSVTEPLLLSSPLLILSTNSIPSRTLPNTVYCLSRKGAGLKHIKN